jgi:hypothetical protein
LANQGRVQPVFSNSRGATQTHVNLQPTQQKHKLRLSHTSRHFLRDRVY